MDFSSFPLLRLDEINLHDTITLEKSITALVSLVESEIQYPLKTSNVRPPDTSLLTYSKKLIGLIQSEIATRRVRLLLKTDIDIDFDAVNNLPDVASKGKSKLKITATKLKFANHADTSSSSCEDMKKSEESYPTIGKPKKIKEIVRSNFKVNSDIKKNNMFMVSSPVYIGKRGGGLRARARAVNVATKLKKHHASDIYKQRMLDNVKMSKRIMIIDRMDKRRKEKTERIKQTNIQKSHLRQKKEEVRKRKHDAVKSEMKLAASKAKCLTTTEGGTEEEGNIVAAAAAAEVMHSADIDIADSDSASSLSSDGSQSTTTEYQGSDDYLPLTFSFLHSENNSNNDDSDDVKDFLHPVLLIDSSKHEELPTDVKSTAVVVRLESEQDHNIDGVQCDQHKIHKRVVCVKGMLECKKIVNKETRMAKDLLSFTDKSCTALTNLYQIKNATNRGNDTSSRRKINEASSGIPDGSHTDPTYHTTFASNVVGDFPVTRIRQSHEIITHTQSTSKRSTGSTTTSKQKTHSGSLFTDIFPSFQNIFSIFDGTKSFRQNDNKGFHSFRECLKYQIKTNMSILNKTIDSLPRTNNHTSHVLTSMHDDTKLTSSSSLLYTVNSPKPEISSIISEVLESYEVGNDWTDITHEPGLGNSWNLLWTWKKTKPNLEHLLICQKISRFQHARFLTRKDYLKKQLQKTSSMACLNHVKVLISSGNMGSSNTRPSTSFSDIMPPTYALPSEYNAFVAEFSSIQNQLEDKTSNVWIMKPVGMSRGRGISLINDIGAVFYSSPTVIQKYIMNPLLFRGFKFDLRLYVTVTSFNPLEAFIYREGLARFSCRKFSGTPDCLDDLQIHLTNSSIQQNYCDEVGPSHPVRLAGKNGGGSKVKITWLWNRLKALGIDTVLLWERINALCLKTLLSVNDEIPFQPNAFEVFGFDVLIDDMLKPWLIEVNSCPSLARDSNLDVLVKECLIKDTIKLLDPAKFDRYELVKICERRLFQKKQKTSHCNLNDKEQLEEDLRTIFKHRLPRKYGQPSLIHVEEYERLAPGTALFDIITRQKNTCK